MSRNDSHHDLCSLRIRTVILYLTAAFFIAAPAAYAAEPIQEDEYRAAMHALAEGRESDARDALNRLREKKLDSPGDWLDLAILHCSLGDLDIAEKLFSDIETRFSPPDAILELIALQRATRCKAMTARSKTKLQVSRGYDSNANQGVRNPNFSIGSGMNRVDLTVLPPFQPIPDHYSGVSLDYRRKQISGQGYESFFKFRMRNYDALSRLDTAALITGIEKIWQAEDWRFKGTAAAGLTTLAGKPYMYQTQLQVNTLPPPLVRNDWRLVAGGGVSRLHYPNFSTSDGYIFESWVGLRNREEKLEWQINGGVMHDRAVKTRPGGNRSGFFGGFSIQFILTGEIEAEIAWQQQRWLSDGIHAPGLVNSRRDQETRLFSAAVSVPVTKRSFFVTEMQTVKNRENISIFEYEGRSIQLSWQYRI